MRPASQINKNQINNKDDRIALTRPEEIFSPVYVAKSNNEDVKNYILNSLGTANYTHSFLWLNLQTIYL